MYVYNWRKATFMTMLEQKSEVRIVHDTRTLKGTQEVFGGPMPAGCLYASSDFVQKNPGTCQVLANAVVHSLKWLQTAGPSDMIKTVPESYLLGDRALYLAACNKVREAISPDGMFPDEGPAGKRLLSHPQVDRVILTGASETAALFASWRPELAINAETSGKNALVITPAADRDLAIADLVHSAFGHAGQKCSAASLGILVGAVYNSARFRRQLIDAASSLVVDWPSNMKATVGPLTEPPSEKLLRALTTLEPGESWLLQPRQLDDTGRLWSPGIKDGVAPGSFFHRTEVFGPVLGLMRATDIDEALALQNATDFGLTAGVHSRDITEVNTWLDHVQAGNLYVNRGITGAIVRRQPFGGWKRSSVGLGSKAGGPNYVLTLGSSDVGKDKLIDWTITWGDGVVETVPTRKTGPSTISKTTSVGPGVAPCGRRFCSTVTITWPRS